MKWLIPYAGETYTFDDSHISVSEARVQKRITNGMTPLATERARYELDPDAWFAALVIARLRIGLSAADALDVDAEQIELIGAMEATTVAGTAEVAEKKAAAEKSAAEPQPDVVDAEPADAAPAG